MHKSVVVNGQTDGYKIKLLHTNRETKQNNNIKSTGQSPQFPETME